MPRIFLSHSSKDNTQATALRQWLIDQRPELTSEIFLDIAHDTGLAPGQRWKDAPSRRSPDRARSRGMGGGWSVYLDRPDW